MPRRCWRINVRSKFDYGLTMCSFRGKDAPREVLRNYAGDYPTVLRGGIGFSVLEGKVNLNLRGTEHPLWSVTMGAYPEAENGLHKGETPATSL